MRLVFFFFFFNVVLYLFCNIGIISFLVNLKTLVAYFICSFEN